MKVQPQRLRKAGGEHLVFNHLRRHAYQRQRVLVVAAVVARDIQRANDLTVRIDDGRARTGQRLVGLHIVLATVDGDGLALGQGGANRVGALGLLRPVAARHQCHARGRFQKIVVAHGVQHQAPCRGQQHHAVGVGDLCVQRLHHRHGVLVEKAVFLQRLRQAGGRQVAGVAGWLAQRHAVGL